MSQKEQLRNYLAQGNAKKVISELLILTKGDADLRNDVIAISARHEKYLKEKFANIAHRQELEIENNNINVALLNIIDKIRDNNERAATLFSDYRYYVMTLFGVFILLLVLKLYSTIFYNKDTTGVTVFVVGQRGCTDFILREKGKVIMRINRTGETKSEDISDKGEAKFSGLAIGEKVTIEIDFSEPYRSINKDTIYTITGNGSICLMAQLENLDKIFGRVIYNEIPLKEVTVSINSIVFSQTDSLGDYTLNIPLEFQKKQQEVYFYKKGFILEKLVAYPQTKTQLDVSLTKSNN